MFKLSGIVLTVLLLMTVSCSMDENGLRKEVTTDMAYVQDPRTGLCFTRSCNAYGAVYCYVPCDQIKYKSLIHLMR